MRVAMCAAAILFATTLAAADDKAAVKEIPTKDLKIGFPKGGRPNMPTEVKSAEDLAKNESLKGAADEIKKQVNFDKEKLVFFAWGGSGGDKITADEKTPGTFVLKRGLTRDFRMHVMLFAVPKDAEVKVVAGK